MDRSEEYRDTMGEFETEGSQNEEDCLMHSYRESQFYLEAYLAVKSEPGVNDDNSGCVYDHEVLKNIDMNGHVEMEEEFKQVSFVENDHISPEDTSSTTVEVSDSRQSITVKTENETQMPTGLDEFPPNFSIKTENNLQINDCHQTENRKTDSELSPKCPSCEQCFSDYLQYLDHRLLCVAVKLPDGAFKVKIETDEATLPYSEQISQNSEMFEQLEGETLQEVKLEVNETSDEIEQSRVATEQHINACKSNIPSQVMPQLLVQNSKIELPSSGTPSQLILIKCLYCNEAIWCNNSLDRSWGLDSYIHHMQNHLNKVNKDGKVDVQNELKILNDYFRKVFPSPCGVTASLCENETCHFIFVDTSAAVKHNLMVHFGFRYVCTKVDCHRIFPDHGSLRSHIIVDHAKPIRADSAKTLKKRKPVTTSTITAEAKSLQRKKDVTNTCRVCGKTFPTSVELKSHMICEHPTMTVKTLEHFDGRCIVKEVPKGVKDAIKKKIKKSKEDERTYTKCDTCEDEKCRCVAGVLQGMEYSETSSGDTRDICYRNVSENSGNSFDRVQTTGDCLKPTQIAWRWVNEYEQKREKVYKGVNNRSARNEETFEQNGECLKYPGEEFDVSSRVKDNMKNESECLPYVKIETTDETDHTPVNKTYHQVDPADINNDAQERPVSRTFRKRKKFGFNRQSDKSIEEEISNKRLKLKFTKTKESVAQEYFGSDKKGISHGESDYIHSISNKSKRHNKVASKRAKIMSCRIREQRSRGQKKQNKCSSNNLRSHLSVCETASDDPVRKSTRNNMTSSEALGKDDNVNEMIHNVLDNTKDISNVINTGALEKASTESGDDFDKDIQKKKLMKRSPKEVSYKKKTNTLKAPYSLENRYRNNVIEVKQETLMCETSSVNCDEIERKPTESTEKGRTMNVNNCFPCKSTGCKLVFDTNEKRRNHIEEQHMAFHPSLIKFRCMNPGCFKGFYRKFDLHEHWRNCTNEQTLHWKSVPTEETLHWKVIPSDNSISLSQNKLLKVLSVGETESKGTEEDVNVKGNIPKLCWYICPMNECNYGSRKKTDIYEHLKTGHVLKNSAKYTQANL